MDASIRRFASQRLPQLLRRFASEARQVELRLTDVTVVTPGEAMTDPAVELGRPVTDVFLMGGEYDWIAGQPRAAAPPTEHSEKAWPLCLVRMRGQGTSEEAVEGDYEWWFISPGGELRREHGTVHSPWPIEFYRYLSKAELGAAEDCYLEPDRAGDLLERVIERALAGSPMRIG